jgi:hypothetical protein
MTPKGSVTVTVTIDGQAATIMIDPATGVLDRNIQIMQWSLVAPSGVTFADPGVTFINSNLPAGFSPWPGFAPLNENDCQVLADANFLPPGPDVVKYKYELNFLGLPSSTTVQFVHPVTGESIDPDMENQPQP